MATPKQLFVVVVVALEGRITHKERERERYRDTQTQTIVNAGDTRGVEDW